MTELILHHYPTSPFSEKIRLIMGYKKLAWKSVIVPQIQPKPDVVALTGGYRKTPFLQVGSDIYCRHGLEFLAQGHSADVWRPPGRPGGAVGRHRQGVW